MRIYSDFPLARSAQVTADVVAVSAIAACVALGIATHALISTFAEFGRSVENAGSGLRSTIADAADAIGGLPLVGDDVRVPLDSASDAARMLQTAGIDQQALVAQAAAIVGLVIAGVPIAFILRYWLARRVAFARRASAAAALLRREGGADLLAFRALSAAGAESVLAISPRAVESWRNGDPTVRRALTDLALREVGIRAR